MLKNQTSEADLLTEPFDDIVSRTSFTKKNLPYPHNFLDALFNGQYPNQSMPDDFDEAFRFVLNALSEKEVEIIEMRFVRNLSQKEIAAQYGISRSRVGQIFLFIFKKLRQEPLVQILRVGLKEGIKAHILPPSFTRIHLLSTDIYELNLSVRTSNCLKRSNIDTVSDLIVLTESEVKSLRNMGKHSVDEIKTTLQLLGLHLYVSCFPNSADSSAREMERSLCIAEIQKSLRDHELDSRPQVPPVSFNPLSMTIGDLKLSLHAFNSLKRAHIATMADLIDLMENHDLSHDIREEIMLKLAALANPQPQLLDNQNITEQDWKQRCQFFETLVLNMDLETCLLKKRIQQLEDDLHAKKQEVQSKDKELHDKDLALQAKCEALHAARAELTAYKNLPLRKKIFAR